MNQLYLKYTGNPAAPQRSVVLELVFVQMIHIERLPAVGQDLLLLLPLRLFLGSFPVVSLFRLQ